MIIPRIRLNRTQLPWLLEIGNRQWWLFDWGQNLSDK